MEVVGGAVPGTVPGTVSDTEARQLPGRWGVKAAEPTPMLETSPISASLTARTCFTRRTNGATRQAANPTATKVAVVVSAGMALS